MGSVEATQSPVYGRVSVVMALPDLDPKLRVRSRADYSKLTEPSNAQIHHLITVPRGIENEVLLFHPSMPGPRLDCFPCSWRPGKDANRTTTSAAGGSYSNSVPCKAHTHLDYEGLGPKTINIYCIHRLH